MKFLIYDDILLKEQTLYYRHEIYKTFYNEFLKILKITDIKRRDLVYDKYCRSFYCRKIFRKQYFNNRSFCRLMKTYSLYEKNRYIDFYQEKAGWTKNFETVWKVQISLAEDFVPLGFVCLVQSDNQGRSRRKWIIHTVSSPPVPGYILRGTKWK